MINRFSKVIIFSLILVSLIFVGVDKVKAAGTLKVDANGTPGGGGYDPCEEYSFVCIFNLAAVRVSYYEGTKFRGSIDIYQKDAYSKGTREKYEKAGAKKNKKENDVTTSAEHELSFVKEFSQKQFDSASSQKTFYTKVWNKLKQKNGETAIDVLNMMKIENPEKKVYSKGNHWFMVEPLFYVKIQSPTSVGNVFYRNGKANWKYFMGTATNVAKTIVGYPSDVLGQSCNQTFTLGGSSYKYDLVYCSRKEKHHVSRIANSLRLKKTWNGISSVDKAIYPKIEMREVANYKKGYGVGVFKFNYKKKKDGEGSGGAAGDGGTDPELRYVCYKTFSSPCSKDDNGIYEISTDVDDESIKGTNDSCFNYTNTSEYGAVEKKFRGDSYTDEDINKMGTNVKKEYENADYCGIYCTKEIVFETPKFGEVKGTIDMKNATFQSNAMFTLEKHVSYTCGVDFKYWDNNDATGETYYKDIYGKNKAGNADYKLLDITDSRPTFAAERLSYRISKTREAIDNVGRCEAKAKFKECAKTIMEGDSKPCTETTGTDEPAIKACGIELLNGGLEDASPESTFIHWYSSYLREWDRVKAAYTECANYKAKVEDFFSNEKIKISDTDGNDFGEISPTIIGSQKFEGDSEGLNLPLPTTPAKDIIKTNELNCDFNKTTKNFKAICLLKQYYEKKIAERGEFSITTDLKWESEKQGVSHNFNLDLKNETNNIEGKYNDIKNVKSETTILGVSDSRDLICKKITGDGKISVPNTNKNTIKFKFENLGAELGICIDGNEKEITVNKDISTESCACPANTYHAGTFAYSWALHGQDDVTAQKLTTGVKCADVMQTVCNNKKLPVYDNYEEEVNENGSSLNKCLAVGRSLAYCNKHASENYYCSDLAINSLVFEKDENENADLNELAKELCGCNKTPPFVYRTVKLNNGVDVTESFPGLNGNGRKIGKNWSKDIAKIVLKRENANYDGTPMYTIILDSQKIKNIRGDNKNYNYGYYNSSNFGPDGAAYKSDFLRKSEFGIVQSSDQSKCIGVNNSKDSFYSCNNYNKYPS